MHRSRFNWFAIASALAVGLAAPRALPAQSHAPVSLGALLTTFLADSGVRTQGLPWTTGNELAIEWQSPTPVKIPYTTQDGSTVSRTGTTRVSMNDGSIVDATVEVAGNEVGIQRVTVGFDAPELPKNLVLAEQTLTAAGIALTPLKCSRDTEGISYGNLVYILKAPGKTASALHESWNCGQDGCGAALTIIYRKKDLASISCFGE